MSRLLSIAAPSAWFVVGLVALAAGQGHHPSGAAIVLGVTCTVRFFRLTRPLVALVAFLLAHVLVWEWAYRGMVPLPTGARIGMEAGVSLVLGLCFLLDRAVARRRHGFGWALVLPAALVAFDFASARLSPGGTWGSIAYSFVDDTVIAQSASLGGWVTLTFLVGWFAATVNRAWEAEPGRARAGVGVLATVLVGLVAFGALRLAPNELAPPVARVACAVAPSTYSAERVEDVWAYTRGVEAGPDSRARAVDRIAASLDEHEAMTMQAARRGATAVLWPEVSASVTPAERPEWIARMTSVAREHGIVVGMGLMVFRPEPRQPSVNEYLLVDPDGTLVAEFVKATRPPGAGHVVGDGVLPAIDLAFGRVTTAICFDLDFPQLIGQAGRMHADILLAPSNDWREVRATHARMARMRAIEQGCALVRPTRDGVSVVCDARGRVIASLTLDDGDTGTLIADVPTDGVRTLYAATGDAFAWTCVVGVVGGGAFGLRRRR